ncbi:oligosaccharide flippase family protein [Nodosilinea sp. PGN35]|uniref:oligosaccharide flippase family protein n=1 Tax=Nodosilinea sp. PGN35 TaxID=3020489 RepID=UPI0023B2F76F|nr:oligosaccharide flippase family protein [Nodosilinea sp. TSF1-S3]MDF0364663.1 oligosaccharide flippase family protein [Nodosilinea sp. TSF1-S3]
MIFRQLAKDTAIYGGADFAGKIVSFISFPIIAAVLSPLAFGALELIGTSTTLLGLFMNCGLNNAVHRYYWDQDTSESQRPTLISSGLTAQIVFGLATLGLGLSLLPWALHQVHQTSLPLSWVGLVAALLFMVASQWLQFNLDVLRLHFAAVQFLIVTFLSRICSVLLALLVVVQWRGGVDGLLMAQALVAFAVLPLALWMVRRDITPAIDLAWMRELVRFGYPFIFASLGYWLFGSMDRWMLASMSSVTETGIYSVAFRFASMVLFISTAFGQAWSPIAIKIRTDHPEKYRTIYAQTLLLLLAIMLLIGGGLSLFAGEIIVLLMPSDYVYSALPLAILCFGVVLQSTQQITAIGIALEKKTALFANLTWLTAGINLALNWVLIPQYGAAGAAWATAVSYFTLTGSYLLFTQQLHPLPIQWGRLTMLLAVGVAMAAVSLYFLASALIWTTMIFKLLLLLASAVLLWMLLPTKTLSYGGMP